MRLPRPLARVGFLGLSGGLTLTGRRELARHARSTFLTLTRENPFSVERARSELGWRPELRPDDAIADAFRWWAHSHGAGGAS